MSKMRRPGFEPGLPDWQSDVLDQTGRPSLHILDEYPDILSLTTPPRALLVSKLVKPFYNN
jgi:hypothetical protein